MKEAAITRLAIVFVLSLCWACSDDTTCGCTASCSGDVVYCGTGPDGTLVCHNSLEDFPWYRGPGDPPVDGGRQPLLDVTSPRFDLADSDDVVMAPDTSISPEEVWEPQDVLPWNGQGQFRGIWVTRWDYNTAQDVATIMENVASWGFNAVFFQVRGTADAYYNSQLEPWSKDLSGTLGQNPGWDPLAAAIDEAHSRELELHAWLNTFPAWSGTDPIPATEPPHILYAHPDWRVVDSGGQIQEFNSSYTFVSPGIPGVREHLKAVVVDIASNYPVDGIHFDYIRYPGPQFSHDPWTLDAFAAAKEDNPGLIWGNFQRNVLSSLVGELYAAIFNVAPQVKVTAAVWGIYKDEFNWGGTSQGYYDYYQDSHGWVAQGHMDAICPMIYWPMTDPKGGWTDFATLADHHQAGAPSRHVYMGMKADQPDFGEVQAEIDYVENMPAPGYVLFAYSTVLAKGYGPMLKETVHAAPAPVPAMPWKE
jgi:uncharacterized lipoprotein YddW (UPF0748 family)